MSIENIHQKITYDYDGFEDCDEGVGGLYILWDYEDETLDDLMNNEHHPKMGKRLNLMWIEKIKEMGDWKLGEKLYILTKSNSDGNFSCWFSKNKKEVGNVHFIVEKNGYVSVRYFNQYTLDEDDEDEIKTNVMFRPESVYNDENCNKLK